MAQGGPGGDWMPAPHPSELHRRTSTKLFEKGTNHSNHRRCPPVCGLPSVPCAGWRVKHVFRPTGSHIHPDPLPFHGLSSPCCGCASWLCPVGVPRVALSQRFSFPRTSDNSFLTWCTRSISSSGCFDFFVAGPISCGGGNDLFPNWDWSAWICNGTFRIGYSYQRHTSEWRTARMPSLLRGSVT